MSKITLQDNNLDAEISLVSIDRETGEAEYLPIDLSSVNYFEIREDLINFGLTGNITFPNWGELLSKLKLGMGSQIKNAGEQYITIQVRDLDLPDQAYRNNGYRFLASTKSSTSLMSNVVDIKQSLEIEEDLTSLLKKISWEVFIESLSKQKVDLQLNTNIAAALSNILEKATENNFEISPTLINRTKINNLVIRDNIIINDFNTDFGTKANDEELSLYELVQNLFNHIIFGNNGAIFDKFHDGITDSQINLPLLKTAGSASTQEGEDGRFLEFSELLTPKHIEFINDYKGTSSGTVKKKDYYTDVYTEEFAIAPVKSNSNSSIHNHIEDYNLIQPDINNLRQTLWGTYKYVDQAEGDPTRTTLSPERDFNFFKTLFEISVLGKNKSNLPFIPKQEQKKFTRKPFGQQQNNVYALSLDLNIVLKSFIFLNETIVFKTKGKMYRRPGKFITIKGDISPSRAEEIWYITNVRHIFENGYYKNEITAVRFLSDGESDNLKLLDYKNKLDSEGMTDFENYEEVQSEEIQSEEITPGARIGPDGRVYIDETPSAGNNFSQSLEE